MEKQIKNFWIAVFFLPAINATVFKNRNCGFVSTLNPNIYQKLHFALNAEFETLILDRV